MAGGHLQKVHNSDISSALFVCHLADSWKVDKGIHSKCLKHILIAIHMLRPGSWQADNMDVCKMSNIVIETSAVSWQQGCLQKVKYNDCSARDWDGKDYLRIIPRVVW